MIKENKTQESEMAFLVCMALMNILILAAIGGFVRLMFLVINETSSINTIVHGKFLP